MAQISYIDIKHIFILNIIQIIRMLCTGFLGLGQWPKYRILISNNYRIIQNQLNISMSSDCTFQ